MAKKVSIKTPTSKAPPKTAEEWVAHREQSKRLTIDVPLSLHSRLKVAAAQHNQSMGEIVRSCIENHLMEIE